MWDGMGARWLHRQRLRRQLPLFLLLHVALVLLGLNTPVLLGFRFNLSVLFRLLFLRRVFRLFFVTILFLLRVSSFFLLRRLQESDKDERDRQFREKTTMHPLQKRSEKLPLEDSEFSY